MEPYQNFLDLCEYRARTIKDKLAYGYYDRDGELITSLSFAELAHDAKSIASRLQATGARGDRVLIICQQDIDYVRALFGCLYSGLIAVPAYAPRNNHNFDRLVAIIASADARILLLSRKQLSLIQPYLDQQGTLKNTTLIAIDDLALTKSNDSASRSWRDPRICAHETAVLQYTSGSTDSPKGVIISNHNLLTNSQMIQQAFGTNQDTCGVLWLPLFHDMGLVSTLQGVFSGYSTHLISPTDFLLRPSSWFKVISKVGATMTSAPNFAYEYCVRKIDDSQFDSLDLSSLKTAINGSELVSQETMEQFSRSFSRLGFREQAFCACYGMAEATLLISGHQNNEAPVGTTLEIDDGSQRQNTATRVSCGKPSINSEVLIVNPDTTEIQPDGMVGEIWVAGKHVASGYWNDVEKTKSVFQAFTSNGRGPFLRTGDLGMFKNNELIITGRMKELLIIRGQNYYLSDIESSVVKTHEALVPNACAAVGIDGETTISIVAELERNTSLELMHHIEMGVREMVSARFGLQVNEVVLIPYRSIPKTSSGKLQRSAILTTLIDGWPSRLNYPSADSKVVINLEQDRKNATTDFDLERRRVEKIARSIFAEKLNVSTVEINLDLPVTALGLDSLSLLDVAVKIEEQTRIRFPSILFLSNSTLVDVINRISSRNFEDHGETGSQNSGNHQGIRDEEPLPLSLGQTALWLIQQEESCIDYNEGIIAKIVGDVDVNILKASLEIISNTHDALRSIFREVDSEAFRFLARDHAFTFSQSIISSDLAFDSARKAIDEPFDLQKETWRCRLISSELESYLVFAFHHIVIDMWSYGEFVSQFCEIYHRLCFGATGVETLAQNPVVKYSEFVKWQSNWLGSPAAREQIEYWKRQLDGAPSRSTLPANNLSIDDGSEKGRKAVFQLDESLSRKLDQCAKQCSVTLYQLMFAAFSHLLIRYSRQSDIVIGMPSSARPLANFAKTIGYFVNVIPIRMKKQEDISVRQWLKQVQKTIIDGISHQHVPLGKILENAQSEGSSKRTPLIQVIFNQHSSQMGIRDRLLPFAQGIAGGVIRLGNAELTSMEHQTEHSQFELAVSIAELSERMSGFIQYRSDLFPSERIERLLQNYFDLLHAYCEQLDANLDSIILPDTVEQQVVRSALTKRNEELSDSNRGNVLELFRQIVKTYPRKIAMESDELSLTYDELNRRSDAVAEYLVNRGIGPGERIVLGFDSRLWQAIAALSVLKAGAVFVPLDLSNPKDRLRFMCISCHASIILTKKSCLDSLPESIAPMVCIDEFREDTDFREKSLECMEFQISEDQAAYCVFTSGSTGRPKGVLVTHKGIRNLVRWYRDAFDVSYDSRASMIAGPGFDVAVMEILPHLCSGSTLFEPTWETRFSPNALRDWIDRKQITHCFLPTPLAESFLETDDARCKLESLKWLQTAGDRLKRYRNRGDSFKFVNMYGPAENSPITTSGEVCDSSSEDAQRGLLPHIGLPINNQSLYVLDDDLRPLPIGVPGQLYISGAGLGQGYVNSAEMTAEVFLPDPFADTAGTRMYATGDVVYFDEQSRLRFVGRKDDQVQIRGCRVETGEIESVLIHHTSVSQCKVIVIDDETVGPILVAYVVLVDSCGHDLRIDDSAQFLYDYLNEKLPKYMHPKSIAILDALPIDANGKVNKFQLPSIKPANRTGRSAPRIGDRIEQEIAKVFSELTGVKDVSCDDDFFALGGHSLLAMKAVSSIGTKFGVSIPIAKLFEFSSVKDLAQCVRELDEDGRITRLSEVEKPQNIPLSPAQQHLWFLQQYNPTSTDYNMSGVVRVQGMVNANELRTAFSHVVARHEILRAYFPAVDGEPIQRLAMDFESPLSFEPLSKVNSQETVQQAVERYRENWERIPFDLTRGPIFRAKFLLVDERSGYLLFCVHHIVADGKSLEVIIQDLSTYFGAVDCPTPDLQFTDYVLWCRAQQSCKSADDSRTFWKNQFKEEVPRLNFRAANSLGSEQNNSSLEQPVGRELRLELPSSCVLRVRDLAQQWETTELPIYFAVFSLVLSRFFGQRDLVIGTPFEGRDLIGLEKMVGLFVNVLPIRISISEQQSFQQLVDHVRASCLKAYEHGRIGQDSLAHIVTGNHRRHVVHDLFQAVFDFQHYIPKSFRLGQADAEIVSIEDTSAKFDLTFKCQIQSKQSFIAINFKSTAVDSDIVEKFLSSYIVAIKRLVEHPSDRISSAPLISDETAIRISKIGCGPKIALPEDTVLQRFERFAKDHPDFLAISCHDGKLLATYRELNELSNQFARVLRLKGILRGDVCAVCLEEKQEFVVSILALLKLGAAYLAIDPAYPEARRNLMLGIARAKAMIVDSEATSENNHQMTTIRFADALELATTEPNKNLDVPISLDEVAYLIFTSGTTGTPNGIRIAHRGLSNLCQWHRRTFEVDHDSNSVRASQTAGLGFDASVWEIWPYLSSGASVWFVPDSERMLSSRMVLWLTKHRITHCFLTTQIAQQIIEEGWTGSDDLRFLMTGGERLLSWTPVGANYLFYNQYGPSEATVVTTSCCVSQKADESGNPPSIGTAIDNVNLYVTDYMGHLLPKGVPGELCIAGLSVMDGYCDNEELNAEKLVVSPWSNTPQSYMYRTGDLVRWNANDELHYIGRVDEQVKIRGYRIEPAEVQNAIRSLKLVDDVFVTAYQHERLGMQLVAYLVLRTDKEFEIVQRIKSDLMTRLPDFMVPSCYKFVRELRMTRNGKVDAKDLPPPDHVDHSPFQAITSESQRQIALIWSDLLGITVDNASANFFELGGHSLLAAKAVARIESKFQRELGLRNFFAAENLAALARSLEETTDHKPLASNSENAMARISPTQKRLWLVQQIDPCNCDYNIVGGLEFTGKIDLDVFRESVRRLIECHEALRTNIVEVDAEVVQVIRDLPDGKDHGLLTICNMREQSIEQQQVYIEEVADRLMSTPFDLENDSLVRMELVVKSDTNSTLLIGFHHISVDAWSVRILLEELLTDYASAVENNTRPPAVSRMQYKTYSDWANANLECRHAELTKFWTGYLAKIDHQNSIPFTELVDGTKARTGATCRKLLPQDLVTQLNQLARSLRVSLFDLLMSAYFVWFGRLTGTVQPIVAIPFNDRGKPELEDVVGFFVNLLPVTCTVSNDLEFTEFVKLLQENLREIYKHHDLPSDQIADLFPEAPLALFRTTFDLQERMISAMQFQGLSVEQIDVGQEPPIADLSMTIRVHHSGQLQLSIVYVAQLFCEETIELWLENFSDLLSSIVRDPTCRIEKLPSLTRQEVKNRRAFQRSFEKEARSGLLHIPISEFALNSPSSPAITTDDEVISFCELEANTNRMANYLIELGVKPGEFVAIESRHSSHSIHAIIATLKAGAAYLMIDLELPEGRWRKILSDSKCRYFISETPQPRIQAIDCAVIAGTPWIKSPETTPEILVNADFPMVLHFTSGSTGEPKGSVLSQRGVFNYLNEVQARYRYTTEDAVLMFAPLTFDASLEEIFAPLIAGGCIHLSDDFSIQSIASFIEICNQRKISILTLPTSYWRLLTEFLAQNCNSRLTHVRLVSIGGEKASVETLKLWRSVAPNTELWNVYGPSECSIGCVVDRIDELPDSSSFVPFIGSIGNTNLFVLDSNMQPSQTAVPGELYVAGYGLGFGYCNDAALTAELFVPNPFSSDGSRLFRTRDIGKFDHAGNLQFLGRADSQIKVDGIRFAPEEVAAVLERHSWVEQAHVVVYESGEYRNPLVAFVKIRVDIKFDLETVQSELRKFLSESLPKHMVPASIVVLEEFPLTANQKIDSSKLLLPQEEKRHIEPPRSEVEKSLCQDWCELLNVKEIGVDENFFASGGTSLLAVRMSARIEQKFSVRLGIRSLFVYPTIRELAKCIDLQLLTSATTNITLHSDEHQLVISPIEPCTDSLAPLSSAQRRLWYLHQMHPESHAYNVPDLLVLQGKLDVQCLKQSIKAVIEQHESLRTIFQVVDGEPVQRVLEPWEINLSQHDVTGSGTDGDSLVRKIVDDQLKHVFDLGKGPLLFFVLIQEQTDRHILLSVFHHIIVDGWSIEIFHRDIARIYNQLTDPGMLGLAKEVVDTHAYASHQRRLQYRDFAQWHNKLLASGRRSRQIEFWRKELGGQIPVLQLPTDFRRTLERTDRGESCAFVVSAECTERLFEFCRTHSTSPFMVLLTAYFGLLHRYSRQEDLLVAIPAHGREREDLEDVIGFFVNTIVIRIGLTPAMTFSRLLEIVTKKCLNAFDCQDVSLDEIMPDVDVQRDMSSNAVFQTLFSYQDADAFERPRFNDLEVSYLNFEHHSAKFDLSLATWLLDGVLNGSFEFATDLFNRNTVDRFKSHFLNFLDGCLRSPDQLLGVHSILNAVEFEYVTQSQKGKVHSPEQAMLVHHVFERQVERTPDRVAIKCGDVCLTYSELNQFANTIAHELIDRGALPEDRVGLIVDRNISYLVSMLGVLKSGAAFIPIDPKYPAQRISQVLYNGSARFSIYEAKHRLVFEAVNRESIGLEFETMMASSVPIGRNPSVDLTPKSLAYIIYTSGSTGVPKGAMIEHEGMLNHLNAKIRDLQLDETDVIAQMAVTTFDVSIWQYLVALLVGGQTVVIQDEAAWEPRELFTQLVQENVTVFESVPSHMKIMNDELESDPNRHDLSKLSVYISNAETLFPDQCYRWFRWLPNVPIINTYGATECSDDTSHFHIASGSQLEYPYVPIHGTLPNLTTYLLNPELQPVPIGVPGEVYIGGVGVGRGYANEPARTAEVYLPDPFSDQPGARIYKTGDLARFRNHGQLEFLGRVDFQVKIRGQRVEIGEVEVAICGHPNIEQAIVVAHQDKWSNTYLIAYAIPAHHPAPSSGELRSRLEQLLPSHMVPASFVFMDEFPLNSNGKIDRRALPELEIDLRSQYEYVPPVTETEKKLAELWGELLGCNAVGKTDSFFELGGHSLLAVKLILKIESEFRVRLKLKTVFESPRLLDYARVLDDALVTAEIVQQSDLKKRPPQIRAQLAPCQIPEWYAYQLAPESPVYNICIADIFFRGEMNQEAFLASWRQILERHDVFHLKFQRSDGFPVQVLDERVQLVEKNVFIDRTYLSSDQVTPEANRLARDIGVSPFDFENGPLFRLHLVSYPDNKHQLIFAIHHIIWDETSLLNLTHELSEFYNAYVDNRPPVVPELKLTYFDYSQWMRESIAGGKFDHHKEYWLNLFRIKPPPLDLPVDFARPNLMTFKGNSIQTWLPRNTARKVQHFIRSNDVTLFMFKLAVLQYYIHRITGQSDFVIGCPIAGRSDERLEPLMGLFATPLPLRCTISSKMTFRDLLKQVSERTIEAFEHYHYPSTEVIEQLQLDKDFSRPRLFSVMFGVQNNKTETLSNLAFRNLELSFEDVLDTENKSSRFDLTFVVDEYGSDIMFSCVYNTDLFLEDSVSTMLKNMTQAIDLLIEDPDIQLSHSSLLSAEGAKDQIRAATGPKVPFDQSATVHQMLELQASKTPNQIAVRSGEQEFNYQTLNALANQMAHYLASLGIGDGENVAVMMPRSFDMILALTAILKSGGCFVPIGTDCPTKRADAILKNSGTRFILTTSEYQNRFNSYFYHVINMDLILGSLHGYSDENPLPSDTGNLAYILHTSGTTGTPKGISIRHRGVVNMIAALQNQYWLTKNDRVLFHTPYTFDVFIQEVFWPLSTGAVVVIAPDAAPRTASWLGQMIDAESITLVEVVPLILDALIDAKTKGSVSELKSLRQVISGGASLSRKISQAFLSMFACKLANHYGPTEVTVDASWYDCKDSFVGSTVPIGYPIANSRILIMDEALSVLPPGVVGEIYIDSPGLACGYVNDDALTAEKFIETKIDGELCRLYKTSDLGKYGPGNAIYFCGRKDRQIKIRGNRVELDEIVSELAAHPQIACAGVRYEERGDADGRLIAFVEQTADNNQFTIGSQTYFAFTLGQRPELMASVKEFLSLFADLDDKTQSETHTWIAEALTWFPDYQLVLTDKHDSVFAIEIAIPLSHSSEVAQVTAADVVRAAIAAENQSLLTLASLSLLSRANSDLVEVLRSETLALAKNKNLPNVVFAKSDFLPSDCSRIEASDTIRVDNLPILQRCRLSRNGIKEFLRGSLPDYMIPEFVHFVTEIPLTDAGKVDVKRLPHIEPGQLNNIRAANTEIQRELLVLWSSLLQIEVNSINSDFFELGGQSLKAVELIARVNDKYSADIELRQFYCQPTVLHLESLIIEAQSVL